MVRQRIDAPVLAVGRIEVAAGTAAVGRTAITLFMDVETVLGIRAPLTCTRPPARVKSSVPATWLPAVGASTATASGRAGSAAAAGAGCGDGCWLQAATSSRPRVRVVGATRLRMIVLR
jgi:hypothetical protein